MAVEPDHKLHKGISAACLRLSRKGVAEVLFWCLADWTCSGNVEGAC